MSPRAGRRPADVGTLSDQARLFQRVLRRLSAPGAYLAAHDDPVQGFTLFAQISASRKPPMKIARAAGQALIAEALVSAVAGYPGRYAITPEGQSHVKRALAGTGAPFEAQHRETGERYISEGAGRGAVHAVNLAESPLAWLASRKGPDGAPLLSPGQVEAGERLREDYARAQLMARVTMDWTRPLSGGARGSDVGLTLSEAALAARQRVGAALRAVGPGLDDVLITICCHLRGLEEAERLMSWPPRAAKIVLKIALERLAEHYGIIRTQNNSRLRAWSE